MTNSIAALLLALVLTPCTDAQLVADYAARQAFIEGKAMTWHDVVAIQARIRRCENGKGWEIGGDS